jgi:acyl-CoA reductase-like NAD-dependent aldehyde dehydrogenase
MPDASSSASVAIEVRSPRDGQIIATVDATSLESLPGLVERAREAQVAWAALSMKERVRRLRVIRHRWLDKANEIAAMLQKEGGKSEIDALMSEVVPSVDLFDYWLKAVPEFLIREPVPLSPINFPGKKAYIDYEPRGVMALITPWNYPASIPLRAIVPGLLAGNAIVWKPSEYSLLTSKVIYELIAQELPPGLLTLVSGDGSVGAALVACPVNLISFTGSVATGKRIAASAAERFIPTSLELGGKNAAIVLEDADLDRTSAGLVWGAFSNAGQNCAAVSRIFVMRQVSGELEKKIRSRVKALRFGPEAGPNVDVGPLVNDRQLARVQSHVEEARSAGATFWSGGEREGTTGNWFAPTVISEPADTLKLTKEETFGPVVSITIVDSETEAVRLANDTEFGLSASLWTRDLKRGERLAKALDVGTVTVNNTSFTPVIPAAPWSGRKASGHGSTNSHRALGEMVQPRFVLLDKSKGGELWWFPHDERFLTIARALLGFLHRNIGRKLSAVPTILKNLPARAKSLRKPVG